MTVRRSPGLIVILLLLTRLTANSQEYSFRTLSSSEGLAEPYVYSVVQDPLGYLWIGTGEGLSRYNGFIIESFSVSESLAENFITSSVCDGNFMWFGHRSGKITFYDGKKFSPIEFGQKNLSSVTQLAKSPDGSIWLSTMNEGFFIAGKDRIIAGADHPLENAGINCFEFIDNKDLLVGTTTGLLRYRPEHVPVNVEKISLGDIEVSAIASIKKMKNGEGFLVATTDDGIFKVTIIESQTVVEKLFRKVNFDFTSIQSLCEDSRGNIWLGSFGNGLIKIFHGSDGVDSIVTFNTASGFITDNVKVVYEDNEGNVWSGNYGDGITKITSKLFSLLSWNKSDYGNNIFSICVDGPDFWLGTGKGLLKTDRNSGRVINFYGRGSGLPEDTVTAILKSNNNELWVGTERSGLFRLNTITGKAGRYPTGDGKLENSITALAMQEELVWAGTKKGLLSIDPATNETNWYSVSKGGLPHNWVNSLFTDSEGMLWVSTHSSILAYIKRKKLIRMSLSSAPGTMTLGPIGEDIFSRIWVGSKGNGVYIIDSDSALSLTSKEGMYSDYCYSIIGNQNHIWVGHKGALSRIQAADFMVNPIPQSEDLPAEYRLNPNAFATDESNRIWFGSDIGLICYDPSGEFSTGNPPVVSIKSLWINGREEELEDGRIVLAPGSYKIRIDFIGISLREPEQVNYQHKLENYDQWSDLSKNTSITYNRITEGNYLFILRAYGGDGAVSVNPVTVNIIIKRPLWKKWWFFPLCIVVIAVLARIYLKWRLFKLITEKRILEEKVSERTREIGEQKTEIEHQRDLIEMKNNNITASITYASNIQQAVMPSKELIGRLIPESFILNKPRDIVSGDFYWISERDGKIIIAVADCTGHGVPGAFMSLLGITLLNEIVDTRGIVHSDMIVTRLRELVVHLLQQGRPDITTRDGMDISLCVIDTGSKTFQYTGAMNDLVFIHEGSISVLKADRMTVSASESYDKFTLNEKSYTPGDIIYLFTDGYKDQFGGEFDRKFLKTAFYTTLFEVSSLSIEEQGEFLEDKLSEWMKNNDQTDDITVMGIRL